MPAAAAPEPEMAEEADAKDVMKSDKPSAKKGRGVASGNAVARARPMQKSAMAPAAQSMESRPNPSGPRNLSALAAVAVEGGSTRYDTPTLVTLPDNTATLVLLLS